MNQQAMFRQLDAAEEKLLSKWDSWLNASFKTIPWSDIERAARSGSRPGVLSRLPPIIVPDAGSLAGMLADHGAEMVAAGQAHGDLLVEELHRKFRNRKLSERFLELPPIMPVEIILPAQDDDITAITYGTRKFADLPGFDFEYDEDPKVIPEKAIGAMEARAMVLAGDVEADLVAQVKKAMVRFLAGTSRLQTENALKDILKSSWDRASNIATTESTYSYNRGRLASFAENRVDYVQFSAVNDSRTSPQCRSRHGRVMRLDDPALPGNTPPLHGRCRSVLVPLYSAYQGDLITPERLDWSLAAPLPKGWKSAA
ncbi:hypothetical protein DCCM_3248 [Desulfocucumis palustris]|uniref:Phage head morphogenesis domain-containing protein n=1 Tax=Desulfocucumis palustris TaxID=1898651 RepID=A0A2L2XIS0_9FIRM|nr:minor capsid protein [Desulfocucumis palustris]GBF34136.1 hypothetical protein DCCM_3248 [Desulfocucumis palustris]